MLRKLMLFCFLLLLEVNGMEKSEEENPLLNLSNDEYSNDSTGYSENHEIQNENDSVENEKTLCFNRVVDQMKSTLKKLFTGHELGCEEHIEHENVNKLIEPENDPNICTHCGQYVGEIESIGTNTSSEQKSIGTNTSFEGKSTAVNTSIEHIPVCSRCNEQRNRCGTNERRIAYHFVNSLLIMLILARFYEVTALEFFEMRVEKNRSAGWDEFLQRMNSCPWPVAIHASIPLNFEFTNLEAVLGVAIGILAYAIFWNFLSKPQLPRYAKFIIPRLLQVFFIYQFVLAQLFN